MCQLKSEGPRCATHAPALFLHAENRCSVYARIRADGSELTPEEQVEYKKLVAKNGVLDVKEKNRLSEYQRILADGSELTDTETANYEKTRKTYLKLSRDVDLNAIAGGALHVRQLAAARLDVLRAAAAHRSFGQRPDRLSITAALAAADKNPDDFRLSPDLEKAADEIVASGELGNMTPTVTRGNGRSYPITSDVINNLKFLADRYHHVRGNSAVEAEKRVRDAYGVVTGLRVNDPEAFATMCNMDATEEEIAALPEQYVRLRTSSHFTQVLALAHSHDFNRFIDARRAAEAKFHSPNNYKNSPDRESNDELIASISAVPHTGEAGCDWKDETTFESYKKQLSHDQALIKAKKYGELLKTYKGFLTTPASMLMKGARPTSTPTSQKRSTSREAMDAAASTLPRGTDPNKKTQPHLPQRLTPQAVPVAAKPTREEPHLPEHLRTRSAAPAASPVKSVDTSNPAQATAPTVKSSAPPSVPTATTPASKSSVLPTFPTLGGMSEGKTSSVSVPLPSAAAPAKAEPKAQYSSSAAESVVLPPAKQVEDEVVEGSIAHFFKMLGMRRKN